MGQVRFVSYFHMVHELRIIFTVFNHWGEKKTKEKHYFVTLKLYTI